MRSLAEAAPGWVWAPELAAPGATLTLGADATHHLVRVCRARVGAAVTLTDGRGGVAHAELVATGREAVARVRERADVASSPARVLVVGAPEGERVDWLVEKAAELGVTALWLTDMARARWRRAGARLERWERLARAALGQTRRAWLTEVSIGGSLDEVVARLPAGSQTWLADPAGGPAVASGLATARSQAAVIGPASGLESAERDRLLGLGFRPICLSSSRLRAETAAMAVAAWWAASDTPRPSRHS
ncbi:MAG: RsmE family RNA methyltransferase [Candidatus Eisenbacteria bacterium]